MLNRNSLKPVRAKTFTITVVVILSNPKAQYLQAVATNKVFVWEIRMTPTAWCMFGPWRETDTDALDMKGVSQYNSLI